MDLDEAQADASEDLIEDLGGEVAGEKDTEQGSLFFVSKKAAAVLKHEILRQYVVPFVSKVGSYATASRVVYLDGYAAARDATLTTPLARQLSFFSPPPRLRHSARSTATSLSGSGRTSSG